MPCACRHFRLSPFEVGLIPVSEKRPGIATSPLFILTSCAQRLLKSLFMPVASEKLALNCPPTPVTMLVQARAQNLLPPAQSFPEEFAQSLSAEVRSPCLLAERAPLRCICLVTPN